jgi:uncharacterized protein YbaR (Trm112 family)
MPDCEEYCITEDPDRLNPAHCPVCKGFLKWVEKEGEGLQPVCNKCHTPLVTIPDSESTEDWEFGKICALKPLKNNPVEEQKSK